MEKTIDLSKSVHALCKEYPEMVEILEGLGFTDIVKPGMLATAGRFMTVLKGAKHKGIEIERIKARLNEKGFTVTE